MLNLEIAMIVVAAALISPVIFELILRWKKSKEIPLTSLGKLEFYPYDLVVFKKPDVKLYNELTGLYNIGIIVGMICTKLGTQPNKFRVLRFNMSDISKPVIKIYAREDISLIDSPLNAVAMNSVMSKLMETPQGMAEFGTNDLTEKVMSKIEDSELEDIFSDLSSTSKKKIIH